MHNHINEIQHFKRHITGQNALLLAADVAEGSQIVADSITHSVGDAFHHAANVVKDSTQDAAIETASDALIGFIGGNTRSLNQIGSRFGSSFARSAKKGAAGVLLSPAIDPVVDAVESGTTSMVRNVTGASTSGGEGLGTDLVGKAAGGATSSLVTAVALDVGASALAGSELGSTLGPVGMAAGAVAGAGIGVASTAASVLLNPDDAHRQRIVERHQAYDANRMTSQESSSFFGNTLQSSAYDALQSSPFFGFARGMDDRVSTYESPP